MTRLPWFDAAAIHAALPPLAAVDLVEAALRGGLDPAADPPRTSVAVPTGELLLMPSAGAHGVGVKLASVAPDNPGRGLPRIHATYVLLDPVTLVPVALLDGTALTSVRTPAVSGVAVRHLAAPDAAHLVVFGTGPQAWGHVATVRALRPITRVSVVARDVDRTADFVARLQDVEARVAMPSAVRDADVVVTATTAGTPLFDARDVADHACVVAIGSHEPDRREVPGELLARATVVVEDRATALRESGDVVLALHEGHLRAADLVELAALVRGDVTSATGPRVFSGTGMAWQDLVAATAVLARAG